MYQGPHCKCGGWGLSGDISTALPAAISSAPGAAQTGLMVASMAGGPVGAIVGAAIFGLSALFGGIFGTSKIGKEKIAGTNVVNNMQQYLQANLDAWNRSGKSVEEQKAAVNGFYEIWNTLVSQCQQVSPDRPQCYTDRQRGGKYDAFVNYLDPIVNDPNVKKDLVTNVASSLGLPSGINWNLWIPVGLIGIGLLLPGDRRRG